MTLTTANKLGTNPVNGRTMVDPMGSNSPLPIDATRIILQNLKRDLPKIALVCRSWQALADDKVFRIMIRPAQTFGTEEWRKYIGVDAGEEPRLPRRAYGDLENEGGLLTFIPEKVKAAKKNGDVEEVTLDSLEAIGSLVKKPLTDLETGYSDYFWKEAIQEKMKSEKPHWVWIKREVGGKNKTYKQHRELAGKEHARIRGARISGLRDTAITLFMKYVRCGEPNFLLDSDNENNYVRVNEKAKRNSWRLILGFVPSGLVVDYDTGRAYENVGFVCAWKFFDSIAPFTNRQVQFKVS